MTTERISEKMEKVIESLQELELRVNESLAKIESYIDTLDAKFKNNRFFDEKFIQGKSTAHSWYETKGEIEKQCSEKMAKKEAAISLCCKKQKMVSEYGCKTYKERKKRKRLFRKARFSRKRWRKNPNKYFKRKTKTFKKYKKKDACPTGKKSCTCWLCHEEGHYASECPKKNKNSKKEFLKLIMSYDMIPIESDISSDEEIYVLTSESESGFSDDEENLN